LCFGWDGEERALGLGDPPVDDLFPVVGDGKESFLGYMKVGGMKMTSSGADSSKKKRCDFLIEGKVFYAEVEKGFLGWAGER